MASIHRHRPPENVCCAIEETIPLLRLGFMIVWMAGKTCSVCYVTFTTVSLWSKYEKYQQKFSPWFWVPCFIHCPISIPIYKYLMIVIILGEESPKRLWFATFRTSSLYQTEDLLREIMVARNGGSTLNRSLCVCVEYGRWILMHSVKRSPEEPNNHNCSRAEPHARALLCESSSTTQTCTHAI